MTPTAQHDTRQDIAGDELRHMIAELSRTTRHRETYTIQHAGTAWSQAWSTRVPPLLVQLRYADSPTQGGRGGSGFESRPAASIESLDTLTRIDLQVSRWIRDLGEDDPTSTVGCVRLLGGLLPSTTRCKRTRPVVHEVTRKVTCCTWHAVEHDVRRWWTQARIVTGWDSPPWRPDNTCPNCGVRRALRIRLSERVGYCSECHETWGPDAYQSLADHIRTESEEEANRVRANAGPCFCEWPPTPVAGLAALCPRCGSASCRHAVRKAGDVA